MIITQTVVSAISNQRHRGLLHVCAALAALVAGTASAEAAQASANASGFMVPKVTPLKAPTPAEVEADAIWALRAALNVAALQCQYSNYLRTVNNYNEIVRYHAPDFLNAQATLNRHFKRVDGARSAKSFDKYSTRTYNSFSTLDAQYAFCEKAAEAGRRILTIKPRKLGPEAAGLYRELRASLSEQEMLALYQIRPLTPLKLPQIEPPGGKRSRQSS
jgi:hypothetical protein